mmetsp:Transcript_9518/g.23442  ORF Transcript_9518/g.23442 Transcript_9518/m.23442 type:complete len:296 (+) Transcript_9518:218-1105(+)
MRLVGSKLLRALFLTTCLQVLAKPVHRNMERVQCRTGPAPAARDTRELCMSARRREIIRCNPGKLPWPNSRPESLKTFYGRNARRSLETRANSKSSDSQIGWHKNKNILWNLPNLLTAMRIFLVPLFVMAFYHPYGQMWAAFVFVAAALTDFLDGFLARKWNICSPFGAFLDPVADKLMVSTALILLSGEEGIWLAIPSAIILCREISVSALREWMAERGKRDSVAVGWTGKVKTACQMAALTGILTERYIASEVLHKSSIGLIFVATWFTITSGVSYFRAAWPVLAANANGDQQ